MLNKRSQTEIDNFFSKLFNTPEELRKATSSSLTQCRAKLSFTAFREAMEQLVQFFYGNYNFKRYYGFRLIAIDGSVYTLPRTEETINEFGENVLSDNRKWIKAQVSFAADVLNQLCANAVIGPYKESENTQALKLFEKLGDNNLYLFDRGYFNLSFLKEVVTSGNQFCFRLKKNACKELIEFIKANLTDTITHIKVDDQQIKVRLTKVLLDTGEPEYLLTSLFDQNTFTPNKLKSLYHLRWGVEEQYKDMKYAICVENFIGKSPNAIKQEFYANILTYNLSMMLCKSAVDRCSNKTMKKRKYQTNKRALLAKVKQCFVKLFFDAKNLCERIGHIIEAVSKESVPIRKNRKAPRGKANKVKIKPHRAYVSVV